MTIVPPVPVMISDSNLPRNTALQLSFGRFYPVEILYVFMFNLRQWLYGYISCR